MVNDNGVLWPFQLIYSRINETVKRRTKEPYLKTVNCGLLKRVPRGVKLKKTMVAQRKASFERVLYLYVRQKPIKM